jgi:hypothetical protein
MDLKRPQSGSEGSYRGILREKLACRWRMACADISR